MKTASILLCGALLGAGGLFFLQRHRAASSTRAAAAHEFEALLARWEREQVAAGERVLTLVVDDAAAPDPLSSPREPSVFERMGLGGSGGPGPFSKALAESEGVVSFPFDREAQRDERGFSRDLAAIVRRAKAVGATVDVLSSGRGAPAALKAAAELSETGDGDIRRLVTAGYDERRLAKNDPGFFSEFARPSSVGEWANVWADRRADPPAISMSYYADGYAGIGLVGSGRLSARTYSSLLGGAREEGYDAAVKELSGLLASLGKGTEPLKGLFKPSGLPPAFSRPPATALAAPERVFRSVSGARSIGASGISPQSGSPAPRTPQTTGYRAEEASAPNVEALRQDRPRPEGGVKVVASAARPIDGDAATGREEGLKDYIVPQLIACAGNEVCQTTLPKRGGILGYMRKNQEMGQTWMYLLCEGNMGIRSQCVEISSLCHLRDGNYRVVGDLSRYRPLTVLEGTRECSSFKFFQ